MSRNTVNWRHKKSVADRLDTSAAAVEAECTIHTVQAAVWMAITPFFCLKYSSQNKRNMVFEIKRYMFQYLRNTNEMESKQPSGWQSSFHLPSCIWNTVYREREIWFSRSRNTCFNIWEIQMKWRASSRLDGNPHFRTCVCSRPKSQLGRPATKVVTNGLRNGFEFSLKKRCLGAARERASHM